MQAEGGGGMSDGGVVKERERDRASRLGGSWVRETGGRGDRAEVDEEPL